MPDSKLPPPRDGSFLPDEDPFDAEVDDATGDMRAQVKAWIWYGFHDAKVIQGWIDENHEAGDAFDLDWIKAFAAATLARKREAEAQWPAETDNDRLERAFARLQERGVCALQWAGDTMRDGFDAVAEALDADGVPEDRYQGFCFFHSQDMDRALDGEGLLLAFGHIDTQGDEDDQRIGRLIVQVLEQHGLKTVWDGTANARIELPSLRWQRRTPA